MVKALAASFLPRVAEQTAELSPLRRYKLRKSGPDGNGELLGLWREGEKIESLGRKIRKVMEAREGAKAEIVNMVGEKVSEEVWKATSFRYEGAATSTRPMKISKSMVRSVLEVTRTIRLADEVRHPRPALAVARMDELAKKTFDQLLTNLRSRSPEEWRNSNAVKVT